MNRDSFYNCARNFYNYSLMIKNKLNTFEKYKQNYDNVRNYIDKKEHINPKLKIKKRTLIKEEYNIEVKEKDDEDYFSDIDSIKGLTDADNVIHIKPKKKVNNNNHQFNNKSSCKTIKENKRIGQASLTQYNDKNKPLPFKELYLKRTKVHNSLNLKVGSNTLGNSMRRSLKTKRENTISNSRDEKKETMKTTSNNKKHHVFPMIHHLNNSSKVNPDLNFSKEHETFTSSICDQKPSKLSLRYLLLRDNEV